MKQLIWRGYFDGVGGIVHATNSIVKSMIDVGMELKIAPVRPITDNHPLVKHVATLEELNAGFDVLHQLPTVMPNSTAYYCVFEFETCPEEWHIPLNNAKLIITQSEFCKEIFERVPGIDKSKIHVAYFPLDPNFKPEGVNLKNLIKNRKSAMFLSDYDFVFGSLFEWVARKKPELMWAAFMEEFPYEEYPNIGFINKINIPGGKSHDFRNWKNWVPKDPRIMIFRERLEDVSAFYRSLDCYCSPTAGEGWGATLAEAMACGIPTIGSRHSGNLSFMNDDNSYLVDVDDWSFIGDDVTNMIPHIVKPSMRWKLPKIESIRKIMREVYELKMAGNPNPKIKEAIKIKDKLSYENIGKQLQKIIPKYL